MAKPELGTKRICPSCGSKYYDLNRDPIVCPRCGAQFEAVARVRAAPAAVDDDEDDIEHESDGKAEFVPLEDADQEEADTGAVLVEGDDDEVEDDSDDTFLEPDEDEEGDDVGDIIGDVDDDEN